MSNWDSIEVAARSQVKLIEVAWNWREGEPREDLHRWLRDFAVKSGQRLVVELVAGWIECDRAIRLEDEYEAYMETQRLKVMKQAGEEKKETKVSNE